MHCRGHIVVSLFAVMVLAMPTTVAAQFGKPGGFGGGQAGGFGSGFAAGNAGKANGNANGNGNGGGNGNGNANGNANGGGPPGAPLPALGATLVGQGLALFGGYLMYRRRRSRFKSQQDV
jgi:hypothetical protein